tara:strand:- start:133 stop:786 length:654 start_codon:yes stop_codon:yes gene_type:complete
MSSFDWIIKEVESGIKALIEKFIQMPYFFYSEQDMQSYLYHKLISGRLGKHLVQNYFRDKSILLHREYPTLGKYSDTRGHFDLAILDPEYVSKSHWRTQVKLPRYSRNRLKVAIEMGLNTDVKTSLDLEHYKKDFNRLTDTENKVERQYLLFFVRKEDYPEKSGRLRIIDKLPVLINQEFEKNRQHAGNIQIIYAECLSPGSERIKIIPEERSSWVF